MKLITRVGMGALAGALATVPQSAAVWGPRWAGLYSRRPAPEVVAHDVTAAAIGEETVDKLPDKAWKPLMLAEHFGYGALGGVLYGLITLVLPPGRVSGLAAGLALWAGSYKGWLPAAKIMPEPERDEQGRQRALLAAHIAYGMALGSTFERLTRKRR